MSFAGLKKSSDRANVILYMREFSDSSCSNRIIRNKVNYIKI